MDDPTNAPPATRAGAALRKCAAHPASDALGECGLCGKGMCDACLGLVNQVAACPACREQVRREMEAEAGSGETLGRGIAGGIVGALAGGLGWAIAAITTGMEIGYVAVGVGWLAGKAVLVATEGKRARSLQVVAAASAVLGLFAGKYFIVAHQAVKGHPGTSYVDPRILAWFFDVRNQAELFSPFDILWIIFAIGIAWRAPAPSPVRIVGRNP